MQYGENEWTDLQKADTAMIAKESGKEKMKGQTYRKLAQQL